MNSTRLQYLKALGIEAWSLRALKSSTQSDKKNDWDTLFTSAQHCTACSLHQTRTHVVFGVGNQKAELMIIGEAPGFYEDQQAEPFVGRAGQLLNAMLKSLTLDRSAVYIANILKCRPPNNRDPLPEEVNLCSPFLQKQIDLIKPKVILALGRIAAHYLLSTKSPMGQLRQKVYRYGIHQIPLIVTYHPAYLLRNPIDKSKALMDLRLTYQTLQKEGIWKKDSERSVQNVI